MIRQGNTGMILARVAALFSGGWMLYAAVGAAALATGAYGGYKLESANYAGYRARTAAAALVAQQHYAAKLLAEQTRYAGAVAQQVLAASAWNAQRTALQAQSIAMQQEIRHASFHAVPTRTTTGVCPGDPFGTLEFVSLFNRASGYADGLPAAAARPTGMLILKRG